MNYFMKQKLGIYAMNNCFLPTSWTKLLGFILFQIAIKASFHKK